jgi:hypothetical protein
MNSKDKEKLLKIIIAKCFLTSVRRGNLFSMAINNIYNGDTKRIVKIISNAYNN